MPPYVSGDSQDPEPIPPHLSDCTGAGGDPIQFLHASIDGDTLWVDVSYTGGCVLHDVVLCWPAQSFLESDPVQAKLELWHEDHGDSCEALVYDSRSFDLGPLAEAWHDAYGPGADTIIVNIGSASLEYPFR